MRFTAERNELRLATLFVGSIQVLWSVLPSIEADSRLERVLGHFHQAYEWLVVQLTLGVILILGSCCRWRSGRQIGLVLSCGMWTAYTWLWIRYMVEVKWMVGSVLMTAPLLAVFCFALFVNDVLQKPALHTGGRNDGN